MKPLVIYHADCIDGYGAAFAAWLKLGDEAEYLPMHYNSAEYNPQDRCFVVGKTCHYIQDREVYVLDFSFGRQLMDELFSTAKRVVWLDHHKTAFEMWCGMPPSDTFQSFFDPHDDAAVAHYILLDNNRSGALLAWEYFHPGTEVPMLIRHIDDRDRWQFKLNGSKELHAALSSYKPWSFEQWKELIDTEYDPESMNVRYASGAAILRAQDQHVASMVKQARKCEIQYDRQEQIPQREIPWRGGYVKTAGVRVIREKFDGLAVNASLHQSEVGQELANQSGTFGLVWYMDSGTRVRCSLRSNGDYDVSGIARAFGGGGHRNAAGFETDVTTLMGWLR